MTEEFKKAIYESCLYAAKQMTQEQIKDMSWFGRNVNGKSPLTK